MFPLRRASSVPCAAVAMPSMSVPMAARRYERSMRGDYDCIILDLGLPDIDGTEVLRLVRRQNQHTPVVILSAREEAPDRVLGLDLGADDYVPKPFDLGELEARIRAVTRRSIARRGADILVGELRLSLSERQAYVAGKPTPLVPREFAVLECLLLRQGQVVSKRQLQRTDHGLG